MGQKNLSLWRLAAFATPVTPVTVAFVPMVLLVPGFYTQDLGLDTAAVGFALVIARLVDAISDPTVGVLSDRTRTRFGRRRPWIVVGAICLALATWNLFTRAEPPGLSWLYISIILFYLSWTLVFIPHQAWGIELVRNYNERTRLNVCLAICNTSGVFIISLIPFLLLSPYGAPVKQFLFGWAMDGKVNLPERLDSIINFSGSGTVPFSEIMYLLAIIVVIMLPISVALVLFAGFERDSRGSADAPHWRSTVTLLQRNQPFTRMVIANFFLQISVQIWAASQAFYLIYILELPDAFLLLVLFNQGFGLLTVPLWGYIAKKIGRGRAMSVAGILMAIGYLILMVMPAGFLLLAILPYLLLGMGTDGKWMLPIGLAGDVSDYDQWRNKQKEPALHLSVLFLSNKIGIAMGGFALVFLGWFGFQPGAENSEAAITALKYFPTTICLLGSVIGAAIMWNFPITPTRHAAIERRLNRREAESLEETA